MCRRLNLICLLLSLVFCGCIASAQSLIPAPKEIKYLSDKQAKLKSVDAKVVPIVGAPAEQYTLKIKRGKAVIIAQSKQAECWGTS